MVEVVLVVVLVVVVLAGVVLDIVILNVVVIAGTVLKLSDVVVGVVILAGNMPDLIILGVVVLEMIDACIPSCIPGKRGKRLEKNLPLSDLISLALLVSLPKKASKMGNPFVQFKRQISRNHLFIVCSLLDAPSLAVNPLLNFYWFQVKPFTVISR